MPTCEFHLKSDCEISVGTAAATPAGGEPVKMDRTSEQLRVVIVGHVDHGKSTLVGRLFFETGSLPEGKLEQLQGVAQRRGVPFEWANLMDALQAERDQNITIDTAQIWFRTVRRQYVLIDAPGHKEFLKNMVTGASSAEAALVLIDANEGVQEQSKRHGYLLSLLGVKQLAVLVNKMDLVGYDEARFQSVASDYLTFLQGLGVTPSTVIPVSARCGDNLAQRSDNMPWWEGSTVVEVLDNFTPAPPVVDKPLRFVVQDVYRFDQRRIIAGRVESGRLRVGDRLLFSPGNKISAVRTIEVWNAPTPSEAVAGESVGITLAEQVFVERGAVASVEKEPPFELPCFKARMFWLGRSPFLRGRSYKLKLATQELECEIDQIARVVDASTLERVQDGEIRGRVARHEVAELHLRTKRPLVFDVHSQIPVTGRFVLVDHYDVAGGGIVLEDHYPQRTSDAQHKSTNIFWSTGNVTDEQRTLRNGHLGCVVWLTGLSAAGKSTIAAELERRLFQMGRQVFVLDGDRVRHGLCSDLGFSPEDRRENIRRVGEVAKLFAESGMIVITAFISPYRADRDLVRGIMAPDHFVEVFVNAPVEVCEKRDPKGLYQKARLGEIQSFTGVSAPYETPLHPEVELRTDLHGPEECVDLLVDYLKRFDRAGGIDR